MSRLPAVALAVVLATMPLSAQVVPGTGSDIGSLSADRARVDQLSGRQSPASADSLPLPRLRAIWPSLDIAWNSEVPAGGNDGALWAGRGVSALISGGLSVRSRSHGINIQADLAPDLTYSRNDPFQIIPGQAPKRSSFSSPWHVGASSADLPLRFGDQPVRSIGLGQSALTLTRGRISVGASSTNEWWGSGIRNTLVLSNNAAGIPRLFIRTAQPLRGNWGELDARLFIGALTESPFFDYDAGNNVRSASGLLITVRPAIDSNLTLGIARLVIAPLGSNWSVFTHSFDVLSRWQSNREPWDTLPDGRSTQQTDQITSLFARWVLPESGAEVYAEWARSEVPRSLRELALAPYSSGAYVLGMQWATPSRRASRLRLQAEVSYLEQTDVWPDHLPMDYYTGRAATQGFTQRGQVLGAQIGPGSSSQFVGADWLGRSWQAGIFSGRTRTENDALYRQNDPRDTRHDVTYYGGLRGGGPFAATDVSAELVVARRLNYLFQSNYYIDGPVLATDLTNVSLRFHVSPR